MEELVIYPDVILFENIVLNFLILLVTSRFAKRPASTLRLFLGAIIGALYVMILILIPTMKIYNTLFAKVILSLFMIAVTFNLEKVSTFIKTLAIFYVSTFVFAGGAYAFIYFTQGGNFLVMGIYGVPFLYSNWIFILFSAIMVVIIIKIFWDTVQNRHIKSKLMVSVTISFEDKQTNLAALIDTGNSLHDPLTHIPVIIVEFKAVKELLPQEIQGIFMQAKENDLCCVTDIVSKSSWFSRFRLIPFSSIGKENGMLIGFKPDYIEIGENDEKKGIRDVIVGIYNRTLSKNDKYKALLSPELI